MGFGGKERGVIKYRRDAAMAHGGIWMTPVCYSRAGGRARRRSGSYQTSNMCMNMNTNIERDDKNSVIEMCICQ